MPKHATRKPARKRIARGTLVAFQLGGTTVTGTVIEEPRPGPGDVRLLRVRLRDEMVEPDEFDVREDRVTPVYAAAG